MTWPPLDSLLPTPRDDEPRSLRENLMDEVRDHLQSAYLGELLKTPDPVQAKKNVLARFGNPAIRPLSMTWKLRPVREYQFTQTWACRAARDPERSVYRQFPHRISGSDSSQPPPG